MTSSRPTQMDQQSGRSSGEMQESNCGLSVGRSSSEDLPPATPASHTPGPWRAKQANRILGCNAHGQIYVHAKDVTVAAMLDGDQQANAALIASAPALLAAAQCAANVLFLLQDEVKALGCNAKNVPQQLRAAIALATKEKS